jgi:protein required for attachment to host cells
LTLVNALLTYEGILIEPIEEDGMREPRIGFLIADGEHARFVVRDPDTRAYRTVWTRTAEALRHGATTHDAPPTRVHESVGNVRHAVTPKTDPHDKAKSNFAHAAASAANAVAAEAGCDPVVIVAPARLLPEFRPGLGTGRDAGSEAFDLAKDLAKTRDEDLPDHLDPIVRSIAVHPRAAS